MITAMTIQWRTTHSDCDGAPLEGGYCVGILFNNALLWDMWHHDTKMQARERAVEIWGIFLKAQQAQ